MGLAILAAHAAPFGQPRQVILILTCDGAHDEPIRDTFTQETHDERVAAARGAGLSLRVGDDAKTLCRACRRDWMNQPTVAERERQLEFGI